VGACGPWPRWEGRGASRVVAVGLSAACGVEEPAGPRGWLKREEKLGLKGGKKGLV
jgi:hypothetical protein